MAVEEEEGVLTTQPIKDSPRQCESRVRRGRMAALAGECCSESREVVIIFDSLVPSSVSISYMATTSVCRELV